MCTTTDLTLLPNSDSLINWIECLEASYDVEILDVSMDDTQVYGIATCGRTAESCEFVINLVDSAWCFNWKF